MPSWGFRTPLFAGDDCLSPGSDMLTWSKRAFIGGLAILAFKVKRFFLVGSANGKSRKSVGSQVKGGLMHRPWLDCTGTAAERWEGAPASGRISFSREWPGLKSICRLLEDFGLVPLFESRS